MGPGRTRLGVAAGSVVESVWICTTVVLAGSLAVVALCHMLLHHSHKEEVEQQVASTLDLGAPWPGTCPRKSPPGCLAPVLCCTLPAAAATTTRALHAAKESPLTLRQGTVCWKTARQHQALPSLQEATAATDLMQDTCGSLKQ